METKGLPKREAYDLVRHEFYKLRQREEIEKRIAIEEARMVGAYFGKTRLQIGLDVEDNEYEHWKEWATTTINKLGQESQAIRALEDSADPDSAAVTEGDEALAL